MFQQQGDLLLASSLSVSVGPILARSTADREVPGSNPTLS